jgi:hypothetical protein
MKDVQAMCKKISGLPNDRGGVLSYNLRRLKGFVFWVKRSPQAVKKRASMTFDLDMQDTTREWILKKRDLEDAKIDA